MNDFSNSLICDECLKCFKERKKLNRHIKEQHMEILYNCLYCKKAFKRKEHLT